MGDGITRGFTILTCGIFFAAFCAIFITKPIFFQSEPNRESEQYITEVRFPSFFRTHQKQLEFTTMINKYLPRDLCCDRTYLTPTEMQEVNGNTRTIVQFQNHKQFVVNCTCAGSDEVCDIAVTLISAVYQHDTDPITYNVGQFKAFPCCTCACPR